MENFFNYSRPPPVHPGRCPHIQTSECNNFSTSSSSPPLALQNNHHFLKERRKGIVGQAPRRGSGSGGGGGTKLSNNPQSVAARERRHRISDRFRILKSLVPGGSKMDTVSMLEKAIHHVKFLKAQIWLHQAAMMLHGQEESSPFTLTANSNAMIASPFSQVMLNDSMVDSVNNLVNGSFQGEQKMTADHYGFNY